jgi:DNA end-binding protein Ku
MARSIWSGAISFGLVNIPVKLYTAVRSRGIGFHMLHAKDGARVRQQLVCPLEDKEIPRDQTVRGFEVAPDQYVTVDDKELEAIAPEASRAINISEFVNQADIDPIFFDRPYYLLPDEQGAKAFRLLMDAMASEGKVALAKFVMRGTEYLAVLRVGDGVLLLETMHFAQDIVDSRTVGALPSNIKATEAEVRMARQLIDSMSGKFRPEKFKDEYTSRVEEMLREKAKGKVIAVAPEPKRPAQVINLLDALQASLKATGKELPPAKAKAATPARKAVAKGARRRKAA